MAVISVPASGSPTVNGTALALAISTTSVLGDIIELEAGGTYQGHFQLIDKGAGTSYISIQTDALASLPEGERVDPSQTSLMAKIVTDGADFAISIEPSAHHWKLQGLEITTTSTASLVPYLIHTSSNAVLATAPHHITIDRCYLHPYETDPVVYRMAEQGMSPDGADMTITNNYIGDFFGFRPEGAIDTVLAATKASPCTITMPTGVFSDPGHKFLISFSGATGEWAILNGTKVATYVGPTQVTLENYSWPDFVLSNVNTSGIASSFVGTGQTVSRLQQSLSTPRGILISLGPGPYVIHNNFIEGYYTPIFTGGAGGTFIDSANVVTVTAVGAIDRVTLSGLGNLEVGDLIAFDEFEPQAITAASNASTCRLTVATHRYPAGTRLGPEGPGLTMSGLSGGTWAAINGVQYWAIVIDATHLDVYANSDYSVPLNSTGFGTLVTTTAKWNPLSKGALQWSVGKVTSINPSTKEITYAYQGHAIHLTAGNGAGVPVANECTAQFNGRVLENLRIEQNTFNIKREWLDLIRDVAATGDLIGSGPKGFWEAKMANRVVVDGNTFSISGIIREKSTPGVLVLNQANQSGATPWTELSYWTVRNNLFLRCGNNIIGHEEEYESGVSSHGLIYENNLAIGFAGGTRLTDCHDVRIRHNTWRNRPPDGAIDYQGWIIVVFGGDNAIIQDNVATQMVGYNLQSIVTTWMPTADHNYLIGVNAAQYSDPAPVANDAAMKFVDVATADAGGDYHGLMLAADSPGHNAGSDGRDVGVNFALLDRALGLKRPILR